MRAAEKHAAALVTQADLSRTPLSQQAMTARTTRWLRSLTSSSQAKAQAVLTEEWLRAQSTQLYGMDLLDPKLPQHARRDVENVTACLSLLEVPTPQSTAPIKDLKAALDAIEPGFAKALLATVQRRNRDPDFAAKLDQARERVRNAATALTPVQAQVASDFAEPEAPGDSDSVPAALRAAQEGETGVMIFLLLVVFVAGLAAATQDKDVAPDDEDEETPT